MSESSAPRPAASTHFQDDHGAVVDHHDEEALAAAIAEETHRLYWANRWTAPLGTSVVAVVVFLSLRDSFPSIPLLLWTASLFVISAVIALSFGIPKFAAYTGRQGLPLLIPPSHFLIGLTCGLLLWLGPEATDATGGLWIILAALFAMSAGVSSMSNVNHLRILLLVPMWTVASVALIRASQWVPALGGVVFLAISTTNEIRSTELWRDVVSLRFRESQHAERNAWRAKHDELTGLLNRAGVIGHLGTGAPATALFVDLDHFKEANDRFGHAMGDRVLQQVARRLEQEAPGNAKVARIGGDEFFIMVEGRLHDNEAMELGANIIAALEEPFGIDSTEEIWISASVGYTSLEAGESDTSRLMVEADHAMLQAKRRGRRQVAAFTSGLEETLKARTGLESSLRKAVRSRSIDCALQPVFDLRTGRIELVEMLARWTLDSGSAVPPAVFIPLAEQVGLIDELTEQMLDTAGRLLRAWGHVPALQDARVSVNVSPVQVAKGKLLDVATAVVAEHAIAPGKLVLELTESATLSKMRSTVELFDELRSLGVSLLLDDFGTGYSSLGHLLSLPLTGVKIDRSLITGLGGDPRQRAVMTAVRDLAVVLGHEVIAEGVENSRQVEALLDMGITSGQGYGLMRPVPAEDLVEQIGLLDPGTQQLKIRGGLR